MASTILQRWSSSFHGYVYIKKDRVSAGFARVAWVPGRPTGSTGFHRVNSQTAFYLDSDRSQARVDPPGRSGFQNYGYVCSLCFRLIGMLGCLEKFMVHDHSFYRISCIFTHIAIFISCL